MDMHKAPLLSTLAALVSFSACAEPSGPRGVRGPRGSAPKVAPLQELEPLAPPRIGLTIEDAAFTEVTGLAAQLTLQVAAQLPEGEPDFVAADAHAWFAVAHPTERVILADGEVVASGDPEERAEQGLLVHGFTDLGVTVGKDDERTQRFELRVNFCDPSQRSHEPCTNAPLHAMLPCGETLPLQVRFENGYGDARAIEASPAITITRNTGPWCGDDAGGNGFAIVGDPAFVEGAKGINRLYVPVTQESFAGYRGQGQGRVYVRVSDPAGLEDGCLISPSRARRANVPARPDGATQWIAMGFDASSKKASEEACLPCNVRVHLSVWHEFANVEDSATQTDDVTFTRTTGRGCR